MGLVLCRACAQVPKTPPEKRAVLSPADQIAWDRFAAAALMGLTGTMFGDEVPDPQGYGELAARMATEVMKHREKEKQK